MVPKKGGSRTPVGRIIDKTRFVRFENGDAIPLTARFSLSSLIDGQHLSREKPMITDATLSAAPVTRYFVINYFALKSTGRSEAVGFWGFRYREQATGGDTVRVSGTTPSCAVRS